MTGPAAVGTIPSEAPPARIGADERRKVFHLSDGNPLACEVDQKIEAAGSN